MRVRSTLTVTTVHCFELCQNARRRRLLVNPSCDNNALGSKIVCEQPRRSVRYARALSEFSRRSVHGVLSKPTWIVVIPARGRNAARLA